MKEQYRETDVVRNILDIQFGVLSAQDMQQLSHAHIVSSDLYSANKLAREPAPHGVLDRRMVSAILIPYVLYSTRFVLHTIYAAHYVTGVSLETHCNTNY